MAPNLNDSFDIPTLRIIDAAINRASEGLRVVEDYARMVLNDAHLTERLKRLRHRLQVVTSVFNSDDLISSRDTRHDIGSTISTETEFQRNSNSGIIQANMARVQQSLRTVEEYVKLAAPELAKQLEPLRYESYTLEKAILTTVLSLNHLQHAHLYVLTDGCSTNELFEIRVQALVEARVDVIQLRDKSLTDRQLLERGKILNQHCRPAEVRWVINDRPDICVAAGADGVHLGQDDLPVFLTRRIVGPAKLIGVSTHSIDQARQAVVDGANYIGVGPMFPSGTKTFSDFTGTELAAQVAQEIRLPAFAIGGIQSDNIESVIKTGIARVAIQGAITQAPSPKLAAEHFLKLLKK
jgi:thiamine-phosphate pyrophosphorylase